VSGEDALGAGLAQGEPADGASGSTSATPPPEAPVPGTLATVRAAFSRWGRWLLLAVGALATVLLVRGVGADKVWLALSTAAPWLPVIIGLELGIFSMDALAIRSLLGEDGQKVPPRAWIRSSALAYAIMIFLPAGRAGGELARASILARHVGGPKAAAAAAKLQAAVLFANFVASVPAAITVATVTGADSPLGVLVLANGVVTLVLGVVVIWAARTTHPESWLARKVLPKDAGQAFYTAIRAMPAVPVRPILLCTAGRALQALQYGIIVLAVGGVLTAQSALVAQGIHLVGAGLGDFVPNQVGVTEGAYGLFASALGLSTHRATSVAIALVARVSQFLLAGLAALLASVIIREPAPKATA